jgi:hypothetical protein
VPFQEKVFREPGPGKNQIYTTYGIFPPVPNLPNLSQNSLLWTTTSASFATTTQHLISRKAVDTTTKRDPSSGLTTLTTASVVHHSLSLCELSFLTNPKYKKVIEFLFFYLTKSTQQKTNLRSSSLIGNNRYIKKLSRLKRHTTKISRSTNRQPPPPPTAKPSHHYHRK